MADGSRGMVACDIIIRQFSLKVTTEDTNSLPCLLDELCHLCGFGKSKQSSLCCLSKPDCMMARRSDNPQTFQQSTSSSRPFNSEAYGGEVKSALHHHDELDSPAVIVSPSPSRGMLIWQGLKSPFTWIFHKIAKLKPECEQAALIRMQERRIKAQDDSLRDLELQLERACGDKQHILQCSAEKEQRLISIMSEKDKALDDAKLHKNQLQTQCRKLETQFAMIEKQTAQESLKSGAYPDDHANPGMLEGACKAVDKAIEDMARVLHGTSITKDLRLGSVELERFVCQISPARPAEFSRANQVKYVWGHWICFQMFRGFEHVFFDVDGGLLTSPWDSKKHALECFQRFQQMQSMSSSNSCSVFDAFCVRKYRDLFPQRLVNQAFLPKGVGVDEHGRFHGDAEIYGHFMAVARAVWSLHELAYSFDPPASILRMAAGTPFDKQFHEPVIHVEDGDGMSQVVMLMIRPAFRIRKSIVRSRVFLCKNPHLEVLTHF